MQARRGGFGPTEVEDALLDRSNAWMCPIDVSAYRVERSPSIDMETMGPALTDELNQLRMTPGTNDEMNPETPVEVWFNLRHFRGRRGAESAVGPNTTEERTRLVPESNSPAIPASSVP